MSFAENLFMALPETDEVFFSPLSIQSALARAAVGSRGRTRREMLDVLGMRDLSDAGLIAAIRMVDQEMTDIPGITLEIANKLYLEVTYRFRHEYILLMQQIAGMTPADFRKAHEVVRGQINKWVLELTHEKIPNLLPPGALDKFTRMVVVNALYFKGLWASRYKELDTHPSDFYLADGTKVTMSTMTQRTEFAYGEDDAMQILLLPYKGMRLGKLVLLPKQGVTLREVEEQMHRFGINQLMDMLDSAMVRVFAPRMEKGWGTVDIKPALQSLGMIDAFEDEHADFAGVAEPGQRRLVIDAVYHKTWMIDTEEGTEAAAATAVTTREAFSIRQTRNVEFRMNRPFVHAIVDTQTGMPLFMGRVLNPTTVPAA